MGEIGNANLPQEKDKPRAPGDAKDPDGTLKFSQPDLESAIFWRVRPEFPNILATDTPFPNAQMGKVGNAKPPQTKDTPRGATDR